MSITIDRPPRLKIKDTGVHPRRWTRKEYHRAAELGIFQPDERLELLDGEILQKMSPQNPPHAAGVGKTARVLERAFGSGHDVRRQLPLVLGTRGEPEPDLVVVPGAPEEYATRHPTSADARLVVEVSDTSLRLDRGRKLAAYARAGISEYWILNLPERQLEVYREPAGARYRSITFYRDQETIAPLLAPQSPVRVSDLLPPLSGEAGDVKGA
jgi:Uma2 family endonuclease